MSLPLSQPRLTCLNSSYRIRRSSPSPWRLRRSRSASSCTVGERTSTETLFEFEQPQIRSNSTPSDPRCDCANRALWGREVSHRRRTFDDIIIAVWFACQRMIPSCSVSPVKVILWCRRRVTGRRGSSWSARVGAPRCYASISCPAFSRAGASRRPSVA